MMLRKLAIGLLFSFWGSLFFGLAFYFTFPSQQAATWAAWQVEEGSGGAWALQTSSVKPWRLMGIRLHDVQLFSRDNPPPRRRRVNSGDNAEAEEPAEEDVAPASLVLSAKDAAARLRLWPLLRGKVGVAVSASLYDGSLDGNITRGTSTVMLDLLAKDLDLSLYPFDGETFSAQLAGRMKVRMEDLLLDSNEPKNSRGMLRIEVDGLKMSEASLMGLTLGEAQFTEAVLRFDVSDGKARVKKGSFVSDLVQIEVGGDINLSSPFNRSRLRLDLDVKLSEELDKLAAMAPNLKEAKDSEGVYHFTCTGTVERPMCREVNQRRASARLRAGLGEEGGPDGDMLDGGGDPADPIDAAERKRQRDERLEERRQRLRERRDARLRDQGRPVPPDGSLPGPDDRPMDDENFPPRIPIDEEPDLDLDRAPRGEEQDDPQPENYVPEGQELGYIEE